MAARRRAPPHAARGPADLRRRGRVRAQVFVGQIRPDPSGHDANQSTRSGAIPTTSSHEPPPTSTTPERSRRDVPERAGSSAEGQPCLLLRGQHRHLEPARFPQSGDERLAVGRLPDRGGGDPTDVGRPEVASRLELGRDDGDHLGDLLRLDLVACRQSPPHVGEGLLLVDLDQLLAVEVRDEQPRRVRTDVDAGTAHDRNGRRPDSGPAAPPRAHSTDVGLPAFAWRHGADQTAAARSAGRSAGRSAARSAGRPAGRPAGRSAARSGCRDRPGQTRPRW